MRRIMVFLWPPLALVSVLAGPVPARAQQGAVTLTMVSQSVWNGPDRPLNIVFRATNTTDQTFDSLSVALTIEARARSRSHYDLSLRAEATSPIFTYAFARAGSIPVGDSKSFSIRQTLELLSTRGVEGLYPLEIELRSDDVPIARMRTPLIFLTEVPAVPLNLAWTWVLSSPVHHRPDGVFVSESLERSIRPGGRVDSMVAALNEMQDVPVTVVVSPVLLQQLRSMVDGYRIALAEEVRTVAPGTGGAADAQRILDELRDVVAQPATEVVALPFGDPSIPALFEAGLANDLSELVRRGRNEVESTLGASPVIRVTRPPYSQLDPGTLARLAARGGQTLLLDPGFLPSEGRFMFTPPAVTQVTGGGRTMAAIVPDVTVTARTLAYPDDPELAARAALGELASIWFEFPGTPGRGAAVLFPEAAPQRPAFFEAFGRLVRASPWLAPATATGFVPAIDPQQAAPLAPRVYPHFSTAYVRSLLGARAQVTRFGNTLDDPADREAELLEPLDHDLLMAESATFIAQSSLGAEFVQHVIRSIRDVYDEVSIPSQVFTLTSQTGELPIVVRNDSGHELNVQIRFVADRRMGFPNGGDHVLALPTGAQILRFAVSARATGLIPIRMQIRTVGSVSPDVITQEQILVRSTAYNRLALLLTIGAAVFLLGWWGRRLIPRRTS
jgi:hypothetical protein